MSNVHMFPYVKKAADLHTYNYIILHCTKYDPALPTESYVPLDCFISTQCFRESLPSSEYIISYKNSLRVTHKPDVL